MLLPHTLRASSGPTRMVTPSPADAPYLHPQMLSVPAPTHTRPHTTPTPAPTPPLRHNHAPRWASPGPVRTDTRPPARPPPA
eukprot:242577-Chlamydomonas_euryale.AAC.1